MANMQNTKTKMSLCDMEKRRTTFEEVALGYTEEEAVQEASRCLNCKNPLCREGCPVAVNIPEFLRLASERRFAEAKKVLSCDNCLASVSGRVCPQENQCEKKCVRAKKGESVAIGRVERFVADYKTEDEEVALPDKSAPRVAVIGSGPAGLTCAGELLLRGYNVTVFEAFHKAGGVLVYGIPEFRLPKAIVERTVEDLKRRGAEFEYNTVIGRTLTLDELFEEGYKAVFIGSGAGLPMFMNIPGEGLVGVYSANEYLTRINLMKAYREDYDTPAPVGKRVAVIGAGNVAMDASRCAIRLGAEEVYIVYRRGREEIPARAEEVEHAEEEGVVFKMLTAPEEILSDDKGHVRALKCSRTELGEPDASGRRRPVKVENSEFELEVDTVIMALGTRPNPLIRSTTENLESDKHGCITTAEDGVTTSRRGVFAGGDAVTGAATVILAMGAGKKAAEKIEEYLKNEA
ncbi:MAG: NADPH-dependent glutamate synthase [Clostridia bacterium]|nr:NADPH-dependent glutamate synthase [Clostridia bacterium]